MSEKETKFQLPLTVIGPTDIAGLLRKLNELEDALAGAAARKAGAAVTLPKSGRLAEVCELNGINLQKVAERKQLTAQLQDIQVHAPVIHMSFASEASESFIHKLMQWFRSEIHPQVLLQIGLQPNLAAGCVLRMPNKYFDLSLRQSLRQANELLFKRLESHSG